MAIRITKGDILIYELPKTGTSYVRDTLTTHGVEWREEQPTSNVCPRHAPWYCYNRASVTASIVRYPIDWYESWYRYHRFGSLDSRKQQLTFEPMRWYPHRMFWSRDGRFELTFDQWLDSVLMFNPAPYTRLVEQFVGPQGYQIVDVVMRTETLHQDLFRMLKDNGHEITGPIKQNRVNESRGEVTWNPILRETVMKNEQEIIRRFYA